MTRKIRNIDKLNIQLHKLNNNLTIHTNQIYTDVHDDLLIHCNNCNSDFSNSWVNIYRSPKCPNCTPGFPHKRTFKEIKEEIKDINPNIIITSKINDNQLIKTQEYLDYKCIIDGYIGKSRISHLLEGVQCPVCSNKVVIPGVNDIATTHPDYIKYFLNKGDTIKYSYGCNDKISIKCPDCGFIKHDVIINNLLRYNFTCPMCSDGLSIPEKFCREILFELKIIFYPQKKFNWSQNKKYDFYIHDYNMIIEVHGIQHYQENNLTDYKKEHKNDILKQQLALKNEIVNYIIVDTRKSEFDWLKDNFIKSLSKYFNLANINWMDIYEKCQKSILLKACELHNNKHSTKEIANILKLSHQTIVNYLKTGNLINKCNFKPRVINRQNIVKLDLSCNLLNTYYSLSEIYKNDLKKRQVSKCCKNNINNKNNKYNGYVWMYEEEYLKYLKELENEENKRRR